jgi:hypothetical protein
MIIINNDEEFLSFLEIMCMQPKDACKDILTFINEKYDKRYPLHFNKRVSLPRLSTIKNPNSSKFSNMSYEERSKIFYENTKRIC